MKIGVFDSGIGGLSVLSEMVKQNEDNEYVYLADLASCPFGSKNKQELRNIFDDAIKFLTKQKADIVICACGTLSSECADKIDLSGTENDIKIMGIIDGIEENIYELGSQNILLLATQATISKRLFENKLRQVGNVNVEGVACSEFVYILENDITDKEHIQRIVDKYISEYSNIDTVILGCTHYPFLLEYIKNSLKKYNANGMKTNIISPGESLVKSKEYLEKVEKYTIKTHKDIEIYTTKESDVLNKVSKQLFNVIPITINGDEKQ